MWLRRGGVGAQKVFLLVRQGYWSLAWRAEALKERRKNATNNRGWDFMDTLPIGIETTDNHAYRQHQANRTLQE
jgi:hypothetical protein